MTCKDLNYFLCWQHKTLAQLAADQTAEIKALQAEKRVLLDALRTYYIDGADAATNSSALPINHALTAGVTK